MLDNSSEVKAVLESTAELTDSLATTLKHFFKLTGIATIHQNRVIPSPREDSENDTHWAIWDNIGEAVAAVSDGWITFNPETKYFTVQDPNGA